MRLAFLLWVGVLFCPKKDAVKVEMQIKTIHGLCLIGLTLLRLGGGALLELGTGLHRGTVTLGIATFAVLEWECGS